MATLEKIRYEPHYFEVTHKSVSHNKKKGYPIIENLPQLFWSNGMPWREANLWALERITSGSALLKTVASNMNGLLNYAKFLELNDIKWFEFPIRKADRCLVRYRGTLIKLRDNGEIAPSTASEYMRICIMFYRWLRNMGFLSDVESLWSDKSYTIKYFDKVGFERTVSGVTADVSIPNRKRIGEVLEGGLLPVSAQDRDLILDFTKNNCSIELYLMLSLGFFTGMRLGSICDLKIQNLERAVPDPYAIGLLRLAIGPGASPPVHSKFNITGHVWIPRSLRDRLLEYIKTLRRATRESRAHPENKNLIFLTRFGNPYGRRGTDQSSAINVEMSKLRKKGIKSNLQILEKFYFHQSRCTFGTELARLALTTCKDTNLVVSMVGNALLHGLNSEAVTFKYIRFIQDFPIKEALSNRFFSEFSGVAAHEE